MDFMEISRITVTDGLCDLAYWHGALRTLHILLCQF